MGFSIVAASAIIGVSVLISIEILTGSLLPTITDIDDSYDDMVERIVDSAQTNINITSVTVTINGSNYDHNISLENSGSVTLDTSNFIILIDGESQEFRCSDPYHYPEKISYFNVSNIAGAGNKRLKVVADNGISDYFEYIV